MSGAPVLDAEHAAFVQRPGISITAASRTAANLPQLGRALAAFFDSDDGLFHVVRSLKWKSEGHTVDAPHVARR